MSEYIPTTEEMREYVNAGWKFKGDFDHWLEQHDAEVAKVTEERIIKRFTELKTYPTGAFQYTELAMLCSCDSHCIDENDFIALIKGENK